MEKQVDDYTLLLKESDGSTEEIAGEDIELEYSSEGTVEKLLKDQNPFLWITALWEKYEMCIRDRDRAGADYGRAGYCDSH